VVWGAEDFVSLVKEVTALDKDAEEFGEFQARGGVMDGEQLTPEKVKEISKWPSREEQLSLLSGQMLGAGLSAFRPIDRSRRDCWRARSSRSPTTRNRILVFSSHRQGFRCRIGLGVVPYLLQAVF
jgi:hypothetical protein